MMKHIPASRYSKEFYMFKGMKFYPKRPFAWKHIPKSSPKGHRVIELLFGTDDFFWEY